MGFARGEDTAVRILDQNNEEQVVFRAKRSASFDPGLEVDIDDFLDDDGPHVSGRNGAPTLSFTAVPNGPAWAQILEYQRRKNSGDPTVRGWRLDVSFTVDHGDAGRARIVMPDCTLSGGGVEAGGRTDKVTTAPTFTSRKFRRL